MSVYSIKLKPVYSQTVLTPKGVSLRDGWSLSWHRVDLLRKSLLLRPPKLK
jgi:CRISPR-associated endonuclease/helicase Cas3